MIHYIHVDETVWPVDVSNELEDSAQWTLRYGAHVHITDHRYSIASVLAAYASLLDPDRTTEDAIAMLRRVRKVVKSG